MGTDFPDSKDEARVFSQLTNTLSLRSADRLQDRTRPRRKRNAERGSLPRSASAKAGARRVRSRIHYVPLHHGNNRRENIVIALTPSLQDTPLGLWEFGSPTLLGRAKARFSAEKARRHIPSRAFFWHTLPKHSRLLLVRRNFIFGVGLSE